jgi:alpha-glucosidase
MTWLPAGDGVLAFDRVPSAPRPGGPGGGVRCVANLSAGPVELPPHDAVLLTSGPLTGDGQLPPDTTAWLSV